MMTQAGDDLIRQTTAGAVLGTELKGAYAWRGIPYAAPPLGPLRFRGPQPPAPWDGVRDCARFGAIPLQGKGLGIRSRRQSEDCLTINVMTPKTPSDTPRPVMVWIYGGAFAVGDSAQKLYANESLAARGDLVLVTFNYRLGALGWVDFSAYNNADRTFETNVGLRDQIAALEWVRENIPNFDGDPEKVTVFGESAGAVSVTTLFASPSAHNLFSAGIAQSSDPMLTLDRPHASEFASWFVEELGEDPTDVGAVQRRLDATGPEDFATATDRMLSRAADVMPGVYGMGPVIDGDLLPVSPTDAFQAGTATAVPLIIGTNEREGALLQLVKSLHLGYNSSRAEKALDLTDPAIRDQVLGLYRGYPSRSSLAEFCGDLHFAIPSGRVARAHAAFAPTWVYRFDVSTRLLDLLGFGATHGTEIPLVMGDTHSAMERTFGILGGARARRAASIRIQDHWISFAHNRVPLDSWPRYDAEDGKVMIFDSERDHVDVNPRSDRFNAWGDYSGWQGLPIPESSGHPSHVGGSVE